jgi:hypothetical protein
MVHPDHRLRTLPVVRRAQHEQDRLAGLPDLETFGADAPDGPSEGLVETGGGRRVLVGAAVALTLVAAAAVAGSGRDTASTSTATSVPAPTTSVAAVPTTDTEAMSPTTAARTPVSASSRSGREGRRPTVQSIEAAEGLVMWTVTERGLMAVHLASGSRRQVTMPFDDDSFRPNGGTMTALGLGFGYSSSTAVWFLSLNGGAPVRLSSEAGALLPGADEAEVIVLQYLPQGARAALWQVGDPSPGSFVAVPQGSYPVGGAGGAVVLAAGAGGTYAWRPGEAASRVATDLPVGQVVHGRVPVRSCDEALRCTQVLLDIATGERLPLPQPDGPSAFLSPSPAGGWVLEIDASTGALVARNAVGTGWVLDRSAGGVVPTWSPDGRWVLWPSGGGVAAWLVGTDAPAEVLALPGITANGSVLLPG